MPYDLKERCASAVDDISRLRQYDINYVCLDFTDSNMQFYNDINELPITFTDDKCFKFIHIEGAHIPYRYDKYMNVYYDYTSTYTGNVEACFTIVNAYLQKLKDSGVYDNTAVIIMSDHGYNRSEYDVSYGRQHAILLAKGFDEHHDTLTVSSAPVSHEEFADMTEKLLNGCNGAEISDYDEGDERERTFMFFEYKGNDHTIYEYTQTGNVDDTDTFLPTGKTIKRH
jgi:hypothetical protein